VSKVEDAVQEKWFLDALDASSDVDAIVVLGSNNKMRTCLRK
jgi:hypothetical protein